MSPLFAELLARAQQRKEAVDPSKAEARAEVDARNERIQEVGPRPVDGVTFGTGRKPK